ncbi:hypothetical protein H5410_063901 [Solanum commersonii]|uniref:Uncharacterized protein n=1 Tax=Solanum commersonii TaxID=4109 RepID=A0A9J5WFL2_SOLCO|nr:hypothetical protein H5410_063901 [Solanum commersonii]
MYPGLQLNAAMLASVGAQSPQEAMQPLNHPSSSKNHQGMCFAYSLPLFPSYPPSYGGSSIFHKEPNSSSSSPSGNKISPVVLFIIVILVVLFFISGLLYLLVRFLIKHPSSSASSQI